MLIVQKFGGTSVGDTDRIKNVANRIKGYYEQGHRLIVVVSAMGHTTDELIDMAMKLNGNPPRREMDMLLSTGEQISMALMAMALEAIEVPAISFTGGQLQIMTDGTHSNARIRGLDTTRLDEAFAQKKVCIVAGFQGVNENQEIMTLGRGGSDTTAVALAVAVKADECEIYTDVDGVYTTDPNKVPKAKKLKQICYEEMLELASMGAGVLHNRSVELASKFGIVVHVRSSFNHNPGTLVVPEEKIMDMEKVLVRGVSLKSDQARVAALDIPDRPGLAAGLFEKLATASINVDMIVQSSGHDGKNTISFTVPSNDLANARGILEKFLAELGGGRIAVEENIAIVSAVGVGMKSHSGVAATMFQALAKENINIEMISTSEIKISVVVQKDQAKRALQAAHTAFGLDQNG
ncbi:MAG TPA: aspartate kinase [Leptospiraceae bacterium]|nr:aspartate kinase [Leptospirales bacterium]HMU83119.1 aspartate kinase [Leptospiraceae bacterium]HMX56283.1 aspartate kinase [Leptospiraceae bacterium]HMZ35928.1 aspartate kinase [Leptospiraceae bacterium]HNE22306.1 aspartate kinase [Leptospiraceae bacterium]